MAMPSKSLARTTAQLILTFALLFTSFGLVHAQAQQPASLAGLYQPVAAPAAIITLGNARFTVLTSRLIRMEWASDGAFEDRASFVFLNRHLPVPAFSVERSDHALTITTTDLSLRFSPVTATEKFTSANLLLTLHVDGKEVQWHPGAPDTGNLRGTARTLDGVMGDRTTLEAGLISRDGWALVDDSDRPLFDSSDFTFSRGAQSAWPWVSTRLPGERVDWYFFGYGHEYKQALGDFVKVAGRIPLPPRFAFGAWWSRYWAYSDQELEELVQGFRRNDVPLDVLVIDMDWHPTFRIGEVQKELDQSGEPKGWTGYTWNKSLFPAPAEFLAKLHADGLKTTLNLHPAGGVEPWEDAYPAMASAMNIDPATRAYVPFKITDKKFATAYFDLLHHPLERQGIDFWWIDWQQKNQTDIPGVNPTFWLNYLHFTDQERHGKRPLLFHRWGGLGNHRYQIGFSGDTISVWDSLAFQPYFTATAANVGYAYWSHDIGGHMPGEVEPELYLRWLQFGAFSPILRTHTTKNPNAERRIWAYPEPYSDAMRDVYHLRYALIPYIYTEARKTYDTGVAFVRPLYYDWPSSPEAYATRGEYRFGDNMVVAPISKPVDRDSGLLHQSVWLPPGEWIEWQTGKHVHGPVTIDRRFSIDQTPVYVAAGSITPMAAPMKTSSEKPLDPLIIEIAPGTGPQATSYSLYEDAADSRDYQVAAYARTSIEAQEVNGVLTVTITPTRGHYKGMAAARSYELRLPGDWPPSSITMNGKALGLTNTGGKPGWRFEGNTLTTLIRVPKTLSTSTTRLQIVRPMSLVRRRSELDSFAGKMSRLRSVYNLLNNNFPFDGPSPELVQLTQTGDRLSYFPLAASAEASDFTRKFPELLTSLRTASGGMTDQQKETYRKFLGSRWDTQEIQIRVNEFNEHARRAGLLLDEYAPQ